ncbi:MAG TPA: MMPL family transporter [Kofleriaceae bacterium]
MTRYVAWLRRNASAIIAVYAVAFAAAIYLVAFRLPLYADFSYLLPQDVPAVRDLRRLESRVKSTDTVLAIVRAPTPEARAATVQDLATGIRRIRPQLIERVDSDDKDIRTFLQAHRDVLVPLGDLEKARDALREKLTAAKLKANPLFIDLEDHAADDAKATKDLDELRAREREADDKLAHPSNVSKDGLVAMIQIRTAFVSTDVARGDELVHALDSVRVHVALAHPGVEIGFTGGVIGALAEHDAITQGMLVSSLVTGVLVGLVLALYFRSATLLVLLVGTIGVATAAAFGMAAFTVGHLNAATAFLGAIIAGNGINYGILMIARYLEERRKREEPKPGPQDPAKIIDEALATAIATTLRPTAVASLGAAIAYGSLAGTSFKGFADFAVIGAVGMLLCWIASYTLLPALMIKFARRVRIAENAPLIGRVLATLLGFRHAGRVVIASALVLGTAGYIAVRYVAADPFEYDIKQLRSEGPDAVVARRWMALSDATFGRGFAGRTIIAADSRDQVPKIVEALEDADQGKPADQQTFGSVDSIEMFVPEDEPKRIAVLGEIRALLDDPALDDLDPKQRDELKALRPPDKIEPITVDNLPASLRDKFVEKDGRVGYLISIRPANKLDEWNGHDLIRFANAVRVIHLTGGGTVTTSGSSVIFADIVASIAHDGPKVTVIAAGLLVIMVMILVGPNRRGVAVLVATTSGSLLMIAACALLGLKVSFLDFIALPITLGLGIDYAINVAHRDAPAHELLATSGSAVFICSLTTIIGYGSLLVSENLAIRGFGTASLIGEITCVLSALVLVPALLGVFRSPHDRAREPARE